jgi:hypothetical protein
MSFTNLSYDKCAVAYDLGQNSNMLNWVLDPNRFENTNKCRIEFGLVGGTNVSHAKGNLVDIESDLIGTTRTASLCPTQKYMNPCAVSNDLNQCQPDKIVIPNTSRSEGRVIDLTPVHLNSCQMVRYKNKLPNRYYPVNF